VISVVKKECYSKVKIQNFDKYFIRWCKVWGNGVGTRGAEKFLPFPIKCEIWGNHCLSELNVGSVLCMSAVYRVAQNLAHFCTPSNFVNTDTILTLFHCQNQEKICNSTITKDLTTPSLKCVATLPCETSVS